MSSKQQRKRKVELNKEKKIVRKVEQMSDVRVVVKLASKDFTSLKGSLTAHVACGFSSKSNGLSASRLLCNKKGSKRSRIGVNALFFLVHFADSAW